MHLLTLRLAAAMTAITATRATRPTSHGDGRPHRDEARAHRRCGIARLRLDERGVTTVEWLGMAAVVVIVVAFLLPQVRSAAASMWGSIVDELDGLFT